jgi:hypothetical protein
MIGVVTKADNSKRYTSPDEPKYYKKIKLAKNEILQKVKQFKI